MIRFLLFFLVFGLPAVTSVRAQMTPVGKVRPDLYRERQIVVGSGGGVTGASGAYYLLENGALYGRSDADKEFTFLGMQSKAATRKLFRTLEQECRIRSLKFDHSGNQYRFVRWKKGRQEYTVTWGDPQNPVPAAFSRFYSAFMALVPAAKRN
ncbi:FAD-binding oxidoreductase [Larkinella soli]|uniref:FAD-binding oxidoreductase n=1 Tax=Larkinella soli TaxID=1770527 RepID=UPI001E2EC669|nr:FAD-binding oxidoreductase [Larkinella soli]